MHTYLEFINLEKRYGAVTALDGVSLRVRRGDIVAVLGPNGSGKSTLFGCLLGTVRPTEGIIRLEGLDITGRPPPGTSYVAERVSLYANRTVAENARFFARLKQVEPNEVPRQLARTGLRGLETRPVRELSKGLLQRLGLAIALLGAPDLLVLDEPFNGLDPVLLDQVLELLRQEHERGATLLISTHTISVVETIATHAAVLLEGNLRAFGAIDELRARGSADNLESAYHRLAREAAKTAPAVVRS